MAQIVEEHVVIKVSQLARDGETAQQRVTAEVADSLVAVVEELVGSGCVVEVATDSEQDQ